MMDSLEEKLKEKVPKGNKTQIQYDLHILLTLGWYRKIKSIHQLTQEQKVAILADYMSAKWDYGLRTET